MKRPRGYDPSKGPLRSYLLAAARNLILKRYRQLRQTCSVDELAEAAHASDREQPLRQLLREEMSRVVQRAVQELPPLQREALVLFEYEQLSLVEIAEVVKADIGSVKSRLHRARHRLRKSLAPYLEGKAAASDRI